MSQQNPFAQSRAAEVWQRFAGLFGADSVKRKFGATPPAEWVGVIGKLDPRELERGMRRLVHSGRDQLPTLPAFVRLCRALADDSINEGPGTARPLPNPETQRGDEWDTAANKHLQAHLTRRLHSDPQCYGRPATSHAMRTMSRERDAAADASPDFVRNVERLIAAKTAWAADMRDLAQNGSVSVERQRECWREYIEEAEAEIAADLHA